MLLLDLELLSIVLDRLSMEIQPYILTMRLSILRVILRLQIVSQFLRLPNYEPMENSQLEHKPE